MNDIATSAPAVDTARPTVDELLNSLTGYDELAITKAFDKSIFELAEQAASHYLRALIFVTELRAGKKADEAKKSVLSLTIRQAQDFFSDEPDEPTPDAPITSAGKGSSPGA